MAKQHKRMTSSGEQAEIKKDDYRQKHDPSFTDFYADDGTTIYEGADLVAERLREAKEANVPDWSFDQGFLEGWDDFNQNGIRNRGEVGTGVVDESLRTKPTWEDFASEGMWRSVLMGAQVLRPDLADATDRYEHFWDGDGEPLRFDYRKYLDNDYSGQAFKASVSGGFEQRAMMAYEAAGLNCEPLELWMDGEFHHGEDFTEPDTENWIKAIGRHPSYAFGKAGVRIDPETGEVLKYSDVNHHAEDQYNFNPGQRDRRTGMMDSQNGRFELTGQAQQFRQVGTAQVSRTVPTGLFCPKPTESKPTAD